VSDLAAQVTAALARSILPSVIARGATIRVAAARDGIITLEADGSPGAVLPILGRIEAQIRAAVPGVTAVRLAAADPPPEAGDLALTTLAIFDKPAMPEGPTFEETLLVTPSRLPKRVLADAVRTAGHAARALGLHTGPVHAELRVTGTGPAMLELAARSIGGLCSRALRFPGGKSLEELILANALGEKVSANGPPTPRPSGVFMVPVPRAGVLRSVEGRADAEAVPGVTGVTITIPRGRPVRPLPDGDQYLAFVFAQAATPDEVQKALTTASQRLRPVIA
jgi:L-amino acid ligase C-terminal domain 2/ATP-grasp domain